LPHLRPEDRRRFDFVVGGVGGVGGVGVGGVGGVGASSAGRPARSHPPPTPLALGAATAVSVGGVVVNGGRRDVSEQELWALLATPIAQVPTDSFFLPCNSFSIDFKWIWIQRSDITFFLTLYSVLFLEFILISFFLVVWVFFKLLLLVAL